MLLPWVCLQQLQASHVHNVARPGVRDHSEVPEAGVDLLLGIVIVGDSFSI
jgi:hypothetical protein